MEIPRRYHTGTEVVGHGVHDLVRRLPHGGCVDFTETFDAEEAEVPATATSGRMHRLMRSVVRRGIAGPDVSNKVPGCPLLTDQRFAASGEVKWRPLAHACSLQFM